MHSGTKRAEVYRVRKNFSAASHLGMLQEYVYLQITIILITVRKPRIKRKNFIDLAGY